MDTDAPFSPSSGLAPSAAADAPSGLVLDEELPVAVLARRLKMAEADLLERAADLARRLARATRRGG